MTNSKPNASFKKHIDRIKLAKQATTLLEQMALAEQSMGLLWEHLFDHLCLHKDNEPDWGKIKELSTILHKLMQNYQHLHHFSLGMTSTNADNNSLSWALSEESLKEIEEQLQLL
ncbi:MAG: hypothetical protein LBE99_04740 [Puniceicoccales bacterium]|jgi:hypothetical protein|nr:hypothetical protein [Puniceicoccales bacterium]